MIEITEVERMWKEKCRDLPEGTEKIHEESQTA
jgi:hypothetical protein